MSTHKILNLMQLNNFWEAVCYDKKNIAITVFSICVSFGWIIAVASYYFKSDDAGRGGAIAVALSFYILFLGKTRGLDIYDALTSDESAEYKVIALASGLNFDYKTQKRQNIYLAVSSIIGTICWGFGDLMVVYVPSSVLTFVRSTSYTVLGHLQHISI